MTIRLDRELEERILNKVKTGAYRSEDEVVEAALTLLDAHDVIDDRELGRVRSAIDKGLHDLEQGDYVSLAEVIAATDVVLDRQRG